ncbi:MAG TPA: hypothetical protein PK916_14840 [Bacteroidota bacterium]|nr:hypothetical protein [Bacteroidota bacterium]
MKSWLRRAFACAVLLFAAGELAAQPYMMPIGPHASVYTASQTRGYWFQAPTSFYIVGMRVPAEAGTANQNIQVMRYNAPVTVWSTTGSNFTTLGYWYNIPGSNIIPCQILVNTGDIIGVLGAKGNTGSSQSHSYGNAYVPSDVFGLPVTLTRHGTQYVINDGVPAGPSKPTWTEPPYQISRVELWYEPPCNIPDGNLFFWLTDAMGNIKNFAEVPGTVYGQYEVRYPAGAANVTILVEFTRIGETTPNYSTTLNDVKPNGSNLFSRQMISLPNTMPPGYYNVTATITTLNSCGNPEAVKLSPISLMVIRPGTVLCRVWPGDVNNDNMVNYSDRKDLNVYIHDANLRSTWLSGPARYRIDATTNPFAYYNWEEQPAIPWDTPEGCYMDADGNGTVNNFDYIAIKLNWLKVRPGTAPKANSFSTVSFDLDQNHPNPFTGETMIRYNLPERSECNLQVVDMLGRTVATLVQGSIEAGTQHVAFSGAGLSPGRYLLRFHTVGLSSGLTFSKTVSMSLVK